MRKLYGPQFAATTQKAQSGVFHRMSTRLTEITIPFNGITASGFTSA